MVKYIIVGSNERNNKPLREILTKDGYQGDLYFIHINYE